MTDQRLDSEELHDQLKRDILERMRTEEEHKKQGSSSQVDSGKLNDLLPGRQISGPEKERVSALVCQIYHELYLERIIVPGIDRGMPPQDMQWPFYRVTDHGQRVLQIREYSPYDPSGYLARLKSEVPDVDETIVRYVAESLDCLRMNCLFAAAVTLGCASEKAMLLLIEQFGQAISDPAKKQDYEDKTSSWMISRKYRAFRDSLDTVLQQLPKELRTPLESHVDGAFNLIRHVRNDAGHPSGEPVTREMIVANQTIFSGYCKYVYSLMDYFAKHGVQL